MKALLMSVVLTLSTNLYAQDLQPVSFSALAKELLKIIPLGTHAGPSGCFVVVAANAGDGDGPGSSGQFLNVLVVSGPNQAGTTVGYSNLRPILGSNQNGVLIASSKYVYHGSDAGHREQGTEYNNLNYNASTQTVSVANNPYHTDFCKLK